MIDKRISIGTSLICQYPSDRKTIDTEVIKPEPLKELENSNTIYSQHTHDIQAHIDADICYTNVGVHMYYWLRGY